MYISNYHIENWRSYRDVTFTFKPPVEGKPLILIGAMNGVGKTSFIMALYLGLFGRFGLKFVEHYNKASGEDRMFYRGAIEKFRKRDAETDLPTVIDITISPTDSEKSAGATEVRIVRKWFFNFNFKLRQGSSAEEVQIYANGKLLGTFDHEAGEDHEKIQSLLFRSDILPAFFFDGEQAQSVIDAAGKWEVRKAVDVLFGTSVVNRAKDRIAKFSQSLSQSMGGKKKVDEQHRKHEQNKIELSKVDSELELFEKELDEKRSALAELRMVKETKFRQLADRGGDREPRLKQLDMDINELSNTIASCKSYIFSEIGNISISLALAKKSHQLRTVLEQEINREKYDSIRTSTENRIHDVLSRALPVPQIHDPILCDLTSEAWEKLRARIIKAIELIYDPPPTNCADEILLSFLSNSERFTQLQNLIPRVNADSIKHKITELQRFEQELSDKVQEQQVIQESYSDVSKLKHEYEELDSELTAMIHNFKEIEVKVQSLKDSRASLLNHIEVFIQQKKNSKGTRSLIDISDQIRSLLEAWRSKLDVLAMDRVLELTTRNFLSIADYKFQGGRIAIPKIDDKGVSSPVFINKFDQEEYFESMSGFERRSFGVSFSLALTELTNFRAPLVIDSPLGNADSEYRYRLLKALSDADLDQIILLTHDEEVTKELHDTVLSDRIEEDHGTYFLIQYDDENEEATVTTNHYFY